MPKFHVIDSKDEIPSRSGWAPAVKFNSKERLVNRQGQEVTPEFQGRKYRLIEKHEHTYSTKERVGRGFLGVILVVGSLFLGLFSKEIRGLFTKGKKSARFGILELSIKKEVPSPGSTLTLLKQNYQSDLNQELKRLRLNGTLPKEVEQSIDHSLQLMEKNKKSIEPKNNQREVKVALGRALEIKNALKDTHFTLLHAQDTRWVIVNYLIKEIIRDSSRYSSENLKHFKFIRIPSTTKTDISKFFLASQIHDHSDKHRLELLSCDAYFLNRTPGESSMHFLSRNYSVVSKGNTSAKIIECANKIIDMELKGKSQKTREQLKKIIEGHIQQIGIAPVGTLQVISVPKEALSKTPGGYLYRSHPFGKPCDCRDKSKIDDNILIERFQDDFLDFNSLCQLEGKSYVPQYRLLTSHLAPGKNIFMKTETPLARDKRRAIKLAMRKALQE